LVFKPAFSFAYADPRLFQFYPYFPAIDGAYVGY